MDVFILHFFKEKTRQFDYERLLSFFNDVPEATIIDTDDASSELRIAYRHPILKSSADFVVSRRSTVQDIYKLDPHFLDVNFRLEVPLLTPTYSSNIIFEITQKLCKEFNFSTYNALYEDVMPFRFEVVSRGFEIAKQNFKDKFSYQLDNYYSYPQIKLNECLKYVNEQYDLHRYYKEQNVYVPNYFVVVDEQNKVHFTMEWAENTRTLFPPHVDFIYYRSGLETSILPYDEVMAKIEKYTTNVPGFIENTKVIEPKQTKKVNKALKKAKFTKVNSTLIRIDLNQVIDI
ncbi:MAG: hypothetical protein PHF62_00135 [Acholeplasmataceae bacterium]|nr:hypothetical protein [Acholeplasmataceae bacterium]MDD4468652.1 hypothetical protein [Acholeplasmataceae bacterium]